MVNSLIVGHGAREHVIAESLVNSGANLFAYMSFKNAGLDELSNGKIKISSETDFPIGSQIKALSWSGTPELLSKIAICSLE